MSLPVKLVVEYDDGSSRELAYADIDGETRLRLAQLGLSPVGDHVGSAKHYLLMQWKDGWQEVLGVEGAFADLLRYYVIERIEDRGRLSLETGGDYPELLIIERTPRDLQAALIVSDDAVKSYALDTAVERWEGIFEAGGKREYVKFDKNSDKYPHEVAGSKEALEAILASLKAALAQKNLDAAGVLAMDESTRVTEYKVLASLANIRGSRRQEDVYGFIESMMTRIAGVA